jgi:hypothetical protein
MACLLYGAKNSESYSSTCGSLTKLRNITPMEINAVEVSTCIRIITSTCYLLNYPANLGDESANDGPLSLRCSAREQLCFATLTYSVQLAAIVSLSHVSLAMLSWASIGEFQPR